MGLLDLFRPKWKHSDATIRLEAVKALISEDLPILTQVLRHDRDVRVRRAALKKVQDAELLSELADKDPDEALRRDAADKASELWLDAALDKDDEALALSAVDRLLGQRALIEVACRAPFPAVRQAALALFKNKDKDKDDRARAEIARRSDDPALRTAAAAAIRDEEVLRDLLCADANRELLLSLLDRVKSPEALEQIARRAKVKAVAKAARERAEAGRPRGPVTPGSPAAANAATPAVTKAGKASAPAAPVSPREELCRRLEAAAKTQDFEDADEFLAGLRAEWQKLGPLPSSDALQKRFERAAARYNERRDAFLKKLQKQRGPQQPAPAKAVAPATSVAPPAPAQPSPAELLRREAEAQRKREREQEEEERRAAQQKERAEEQQRLDRHLSACPACRFELKARADFAALPLPSIPVDELVTRALAGMPSASVAQSAVVQSRRRRFSPGMIAAAVMLVGAASFAAAGLARPIAVLLGIAKPEAITPPVPAPAPIIHPRISPQPPVQVEPEPVVEEKPLPGDRKSVV